MTTAIALALVTLVLCESVHHHMSIARVARCEKSR
jgi:hypothetical protein